MVDLQQRRYERHHFKAPITHSMYNSMDHRNHLVHGYINNFHEGVMVNTSKGGLYFESKTPSRVGSIVYINMVDHVQGMETAKETEALAAKVVWCKKNMKDENIIYRVGISFLEQ